jgi:hypothetical protein
MKMAQFENDKSKIFSAQVIFSQLNVFIFKLRNCRIFKFPLLHNPSFPSRQL